jgi:uncharacterized protein
VIILDTSGLLSAIDSSQRLHAEAAAALRGATGQRLLSPFVLAELDYLLSARVSSTASRQLLGEIGRGAYVLAPMDARDVGRAAEIIDRYADLGIGLADASLVVLAERHDTLDLLTLDERHFRTVRGPRDRPFRLLPADR